jgi:hypothetical protein
MNHNQCLVVPVHSRDGLPIRMEFRIAGPPNKSNCKYSSSSAARNEDRSVDRKFCDADCVWTTTTKSVLDCIAFGQRYSQQSQHQGE